MGCAAGGGNNRRHGHHRHRTRYIVIQQAGATGIGSKQARGQLGWRQRGRFERARDTLIASEVIRVKRGGRGGRLATIDGAELPDDQVLNVATERELYSQLAGPLIDILCSGEEGPEDDVEESSVAIDVTGDLGSMDTGGRYSRPDLVGALRRSMTGFQALEIHGFEVKPYWAAQRVGVYEAVAQRALGLCTHAWVVLYLPDKSVNLREVDRRAVEQVRSRLEAVRREAADLGIGLITFENFSGGGCNVLSHPTRWGPDPHRLDRFLSTACPNLLGRIQLDPAVVVV